LLWAIRIGIVLGLLVAIGYSYDVTLWDWAKLLIVPAVIAAGGLWFNAQQREREQQIASDRAQDEALQAYLDQMSDMLIPNTDQPSLYKARPGDRLSSVARARTLTVLPRLDGYRKARVVQFLHESGLIAKNRTILALSGANLSRADLSGADLVSANLSRAYLFEADLRGANLAGAKLSETNLSKANLSKANLGGANLDWANLHRADLSGTNLTGADLTGADLIGAILRRVQLSRATLSAKLIEADLSDANLFGANISEASLRGAELSNANLDGADLFGTTLKDAKGISSEQLYQHAGSLEGATMPNGQEYEDWLKDREGRGEDGENDSLS